MDKLVRALLDIREIKFRIDDDFPDRLNRQYTSTLLVMFAVLVSARQVGITMRFIFNYVYIHETVPCISQYMGEPIHCWCPEQCASNHETYANVYCWVSNTYFVDVSERLPQVVSMLNGLHMLHIPFIINFTLLCRMKLEDKLRTISGCH